MLEYVDLESVAAISFIDDLVSKCVDETLAGVLGSLVRDSLYLTFLTRLSVTREELPKHLDSLDAMLVENFGSRAAKVLSKAIARRLYSELNLTFEENPQFWLPEYVEEAKSKLRQSNAHKAEKLDSEVKARRKDRAVRDDGCS